MYVAFAYVVFFIGLCLYLIFNVSWFIIVFATPALIGAAYCFILFVKEIGDSFL